MTPERREKLIRDQDWVYETAGADWRDGLLTGNGELGAVASAPSHWEWVLNHVQVFDPSIDKEVLKKRLPHDELMRRIEEMPHKNTLFLRDLEGSFGSRSTISAAVLRMRFWEGIGWAAPSTPQTSQHLFLYDGILQENMTAHSFHPCARQFVSRNHSVFSLKLTDAPERPHVIELIRPANELLPSPEPFHKEGLFAFTQKLPGGRRFYAVAMRIVSRSGKARLTHLSQNCQEIAQSGGMELFLCVKSSLSSRDPLTEAIAAVDAAVKTGFDALEKEHCQWWHRYWDNAYADFGKYKKFQKYYTFSLYELASSFGTAPMPGLNGLAYGPLNEETPGVYCQGYTHDQNAQIPALAFFPTGRVEFIKTLTETYWKIRTVLRRETGKLFHCRGLFLPLSMNQLGEEYCSPTYRRTICGSAYTALVLALAWRYSRDRELLRRHIYPLLREFVLFHQGIMQKDASGTWHFSWSVPPEIVTLTRDENAMTATFKTALQSAVEAAEILHKDRKLLPLWKDMLVHYPPFAKTPEGAYWCGPDVPLDHYFFGGHLCYPLFPAGAENDPAAAKKTLELIESDAVERSYADFEGQWHPNHEWSQFLLTGMRLRSGDRAGGWRGVERFLELFAKENGLFSHDPILIGDIRKSEENARANGVKLQTGRKFCDGKLLTQDNPEVPHPFCVTPNVNAKRLAPAVLEGSSSFLVLASETLLQSHGGVLHLFPAVPDDFTGSFDRFLAEGGFEVSAAMKKGKIVSWKIYGRTGGICRFRLSGGEIQERTLSHGETIRG